MITVSLETVLAITEDNKVSFQSAANAGDLLSDSTAMEAAHSGTITHRILQNHNVSGDSRKLKIKFDAMASHDITYVGIIQTARASGLERFPIPYVLTNCHNSLCAVGGTINEDDHLFGLSAARKYGGEYVPAHVAVIHQYMRERYAGCGKMILASDSHTRYGALGTLSIGEGGPELCKQLLDRTYDIDYPEVIAVYLDGDPAPGVGPQDVALALIGATFNGGLVKNKVLEFMGPGLLNLDIDFRMGIDVMTTETTCLSSIWQTDEKVCEFLKVHGRESEYLALKPEKMAVYDGVIKIDLSKIAPMIALPVHPSNTYSIKEFLESAPDILNSLDKELAIQMGLSTSAPKLISKIRDGNVYADQGVIAGCAGGIFGNLMSAADILRGNSVNSSFALSVYPASQPIYLEIMNNGAAQSIISSGATLKTAFCGPCFGAGDVPANGGFSIRHTTRNFPNREGSKPGAGQVAYVALMDARSIAATAINGGKLTPATDCANLADKMQVEYRYDEAPYRNCVYNGVGKPESKYELKFGPNIADWPKMIPLPENLLMTVAAAIYDPVTTTDELIPSGETSSYRSNPQKLAEFTLSRKDPAYVGRAKENYSLELERRDNPESDKLMDVMKGYDRTKTGLGTVVVARKPGDGSAREQAASCQRVLGGVANIVSEYATRRYRANLVNWGIIPFEYSKMENGEFSVGDIIYIEGIRNAIETGMASILAKIIRGDRSIEVELSLGNLSKEEREVILAGCLINYYTS